MTDEILGPFAFSRGNQQNNRFGDRNNYNRQGQQGGNWQRNNRGNRQDN